MARIARPSRWRRGAPERATVAPAIGQGETTRSIGPRARLRRRWPIPRRTSKTRKPRGRARAVRTIPRGRRRRDPPRARGPRRRSRRSRSTASPGHPRGLGGDRGLPRVDRPPLEARLRAGCESLKRYDARGGRGGDALRSGLERERRNAGTTAAGQSRCPTRRIPIGLTAGFATGIVLNSKGPTGTTPFGFLPAHEAPIRRCSSCPRGSLRPTSFASSERRGASPLARGEAAPPCR